jgi:hypothetical protein
MFRGLLLGDPVRDYDFGVLVGLEEGGDGWIGRRRGRSSVRGGWGGCDRSGQSIVAVLHCGDVAVELGHALADLVSEILHIVEILHAAEVDIMVDGLW